MGRGTGIVQVHKVAAIVFPKWGCLSYSLLLHWIDFLAVVCWCLHRAPVGTSMTCKECRALYAQLEVGNPDKALQDWQAPLSSQGCCPPPAPASFSIFSWGRTAQGSHTLAFHLFFFFFPGGAAVVEIEQLFETEWEWESTVLSGGWKEPAARAGSGLQGPTLKECWAALSQAIKKKKNH